jgi:hypothetical protein
LAAGRLFVKRRMPQTALTSAQTHLAALMLNHGWCKPGLAEAIVANPVEHRRFRNG